MTRDDETDEQQTTRLLATYGVPGSAVADMAKMLDVDVPSRAYRLAGGLTAMLLEIADHHRTCRRKNAGCRICVSIRIGLSQIAADQQLTQKAAARAKQ